MEQRPRRPAAVRKRLTVGRPVVHRFAAQRRARFAQVNTHLMRSACLQTTFDEREIAERFDNGNVRDRALTVFGEEVGCASATAITAVAHEHRFGSPGFWCSAREGEVSSLGGVLAELSSSFPPCAAKIISSEVSRRTAMTGRFGPERRGSRSARVLEETFRRTRRFVRVASW